MLSLISLNLRFNPHLNGTSIRAVIKVVCVDSDSRGIHPRQLVEDASIPPELKRKAKGGKKRERNRVLR